MSNIPSSAMPHAWAPDDAHADAPARTTARSSPSRAMLAGLGAVLAYLVYRAIR